MDKQQQIVSRNSYINSLNDYISSSKVAIQKILDNFGWTEQLTNTENGWERKMVHCSVDPNHIVLSKNVKLHEEACRWRQQGYGKDCVPLPSGSKTRSKGTVTLAVEISAIHQYRLCRSYGDCTDRDVPQTSDRLFSDFTTDERRALYDHVVSLTRDTMPQLQEFAMPAVEDARSSGPLTREQLMAKERDAKRRRVRHRTLKVHTRSKNYTQVVREVINNQMSAYEDWLKAYHGAEGSSDSGQTERAGTEKKEEKPGGDQEMIWLEWDLSCNPHLWWKKVLENEKRERERRKRRERSSSSERQRRRDREQGRRENREYRREGYERDRDRYDRDRDRYDKDRDKYDRDRDRYDRDRRYRGDRHSHKRDRYEEERYLRHREKRRRDRESKRSRDESEEEEPRGKRIARNERERETDKNYGHSNCDSSTVIKEENTNSTQKERLEKEDDLVQNIKIEKDDERDNTLVGNEPTLLESNLSEVVEIKQENFTERGEYGVALEKALLLYDSLETDEIIPKEGEKVDENEVQTLLDDNLLEMVREKLDRGETLDETETLLSDKLLQTVREKLARGETLDERHSHKRDYYEEERYSRDQKERSKGRESKSKKRSRDESEEEEPSRKKIAKKMEKDDQRGKTHIGNDLTLLESNLSAEVEIKQENCTETDENSVASEQALLQDASLQTYKIVQNEGEKRDEIEVQKLLDDNVLETVREKLDRGETLDETETLLGDKLLQTVREKLGRGETLDEREIRLAQRFLFQRLEMIGKELPSDMSSAGGDSDDASSPKKVKKKKGKKKKAKAKQKSKKKHKEKKREGWPDLLD